MCLLRKILFFFHSTWQRRLESNADSLGTRIWKKRRVWLINRMGKALITALTLPSGPELGARPPRFSPVPAPVRRSRRADDHLTRKQWAWCAPAPSGSFLQNDLEPDHKEDCVSVPSFVLCFYLCLSNWKNCVACNRMVILAVKLSFSLYLSSTVSMWEPWQPILSCLFVVDIWLKYWYRKVAR